MNTLGLLTATRSLHCEAQGVHVGLWEISAGRNHRNVMNFSLPASPTVNSSARFRSDPKGRPHTNHATCMACHSGHSQVTTTTSPSIFAVCRRDALQTGEHRRSMVKRRTRSVATHPQHTPSTRHKGKGGAEYQIPSTHPPTQP